MDCTSKLISYLLLGSLLACRMAVAADGFAAVEGKLGSDDYLRGGTVGGLGAAAVTVTTQADLEHFARQPGRLSIYINGLLSIVPFGRRIEVSSHKTIQGLGCGSGLWGGRLEIKNAQDVVLNNLRLGGTYDPKDPKGKCCDNDAVTLRHSNHVWINHCLLERAGDGLIDIVAGSNYVTISWCHLRDHNKVMLIGNGRDLPGDLGHLKVTLHHNLFENLVQRVPSIRCGTAHVYNNAYLNIHSYAALARAHGQILLQNNAFGEGVRNPHSVDADSSLVATGNIYGEKVKGRRQIKAPTEPFDPRRYYAYHLDDPSGLIETLKATSGPCGETPRPESPVYP